MRRMYNKWTKLGVWVLSFLPFLLLLFLTSNHDLLISPPPPLVAYY